MQEIRKVYDEGVTEEEVRIAIKRLKTMLAFRAEDPEFATEWYGRQELYHIPILSLTEYVERIEQVTKEEINAMLKKYILSNNLNLAVVWNRPEDTELVKLLTI
jgi:predicted Zn-dependent peptidase